MARKPDPNSRASRIKAAYYDKKMEIEEISEELDIPIKTIHRELWRHENQVRLRVYDRKYRNHRYRNDPTHRAKHIARVRASQTKPKEEARS